MTDSLEQAYEATLILRAQLRDEAAFEELLLRYSGRLRLYVARMLHERRANTEDLLQEIWLAVFRSLPRLEDVGAFRGWLYRIARDRVCREFRRARLEFRPLVDPDFEDLAADAEPDSGTPIDSEALSLHVGRLSREHREAVVLRFMEGLTYEEMAAVTGQSLGTIRSRIHYAKRALRRFIEENPHAT